MIETNGGVEGDPMPEPSIAPRRVRIADYQSHGCKTVIAMLLSAEQAKFIAFAKHSESRSNNSALSVY